MGRRMYPVVVSLCCLLALATSASADCAWVLWAASARPGNTFNTKDYQPIRAYMTAQDCYKEFNEAIQRADAPKWVYVCLPDTVDPRGPKGK